MVDPEYGSVGTTDHPLAYMSTENGVAYENLTADPPSKARRVWLRVDQQELRYYDDDGNLGKVPLLSSAPSSAYFTITTDGGTTYYINLESKSSADHPNLAVDGGVGAGLAMTGVVEAPQDDFTGDSTTVAGALIDSWEDSDYSEYAVFSGSKSDFSFSSTTGVTDGSVAAELTVTNTEEVIHADPGSGLNDQPEVGLPLTVDVEYDSGGRGGFLAFGTPDDNSESYYLTIQEDIGDFVLQKRTGDNTTSTTLLNETAPFSSHTNERVRILLWKSAGAGGYVEFRDSTGQVFYRGDFDDTSVSGSGTWGQQVGGGNTSSWYWDQAQIPEITRIGGADLEDTQYLGYVPSDVSNPVATANNTFREPGSVLIEPNKSPKYKLYLGDGSEPAQSIAVVTSSDGESWTNEGTFLGSDYQDPSVEVENGTYYMFVEEKSTGNTVRFEGPSYNGITNNKTTVLTTSGSGFDQDVAGSAAAFQHDGSFYLMYEGLDTSTSPNTGKIGLASGSSITDDSLTKSAENPIIGTKNGTWREHQVVSDDVYRRSSDGRWFVLAHGLSGNDEYRMGWFYADDDPANWDSTSFSEIPNNPLPWIPEESGGNASGVEVVGYNDPDTGHIRYLGVVNDESTLRLAEGASLSF